MKLAKVVRTLRGDADVREFGKAIGVSHTSIVQWEAGASISPYNRIRLLDYARRTDATAELVAALEAAQPEVRPGN